jgi:hypothetical protein
MTPLQVKKPSLPSQNIGNGKIEELKEVYA